MTFEERSFSVARNFLQTVVIFDDLARLEEPRLPAAQLVADEDERSEEPTSEDYGERPGQLTAPEVLETSATGEIGVDVKRLSDAFAAEGLICGFLKPAPEEKEEESQLLLEAARRADIVVLDWSIERDEGAAARKLISELIKEDAVQSDKRLRLIAIYTSREDLMAIVDRVAETLQDALHEEPDVSDFAVSSDAVRVVILGKHLPDQTEPDEARYREEDLPRRLIEEFAAFTSGLVPNVVLAGLAAVRIDTHRVLQVLNRDLDAAYLGQRLLLPDPSEAEEQLVELVSSELRSVMEDRRVGDQANAQAVQEWVEWRSRVSGFPFFEEIDPAEAAEQRELLLREGIGGDSLPIQTLRSRKEIGKSKVHKFAHRVFASNESDADRANDDLAMRFALRTHYSNPERVLQLGTIVLRGSDYLLCVQPVCDSLRIEGERDFPFLPLVRREDSFNVVLREDDERVTLCLEQMPHRVQVHRFASDVDKRCVVARLRDNRYEFEDTSGTVYFWIARLQDAQAQRVVHGLSSAFSRVGLSEAEWLRAVAGTS
jgi:hypothetical protein